MEKSRHHEHRKIGLETMSSAAWAHNRKKGGDMSFAPRPYSRGGMSVGFLGEGVLAVDLAMGRDNQTITGTIGIVWGVIIGAAIIYAIWVVAKKIYSWVTDLLDGKDDETKAKDKDKAKESEDTAEGLSAATWSLRADPYAYRSENYVRDGNASFAEIYQ